MLLRKFNFEDPDVKEKFLFNKKNHFSTWEHYCNCYSYSIEKIINKGLLRNYAFNCRARGILFLLRHYFEICLKHNLELSGYKNSDSHNFQDLLSAFVDTEIVPQGFKDVISKIDYDSDGTCYRYYRDKKTGKPFFTNENKIELSELFKCYNEISISEKFKQDNICQAFDYESKRIKWDLTFHMGECHGLGHIRTQYDEVIEFLVEGVLYENYDINKVYLPLLFLIRHSLEIALKFNIYEARKITTIVSNDKIDNTHSLVKLYDYFGGTKGYLSKIDISKMSLELKVEFENFKCQYEKLNNEIHLLDTNSFLFRFPVDKNRIIHSLSMNKDQLYEILKLYYLTDPFITFTNEVLEEEGII